MEDIEIWIVDLTACINDFDSRRKTTHKPDHDADSLYVERPTSTLRSLTLNFSMTIVDLSLLPQVACILDECELLTAQLIYERTT